MLDALQVLLPGLFVVVVVWIGARYAVAGTITPGELVAFYGYSAFLMIPLRTATEFANKVIRARVAATRIVHVLSIEPEVTVPDEIAPSPAAGSDLVDTRTGLRVRAGLLTAIVCEQPDDSAELADRLGMTASPIDDEVRLGGVPLTSLDPVEVRERIVVSDTGAMLFSGPLGDGLDLTGHGDVARALDTASAADVLESLAEGLDTVVAERGRKLLRRPAAARSCLPGRSRSTPRSWCSSSRRPPSTPTPRPGSRPGCVATATAVRRSSPRPAR